MQKSSTIQPRVYYILLIQQDIGKSDEFTIGFDELKFDEKQEITDLNTDF